MDQSLVLEMLNLGPVESRRPRKRNAFLAVEGGEHATRELAPTSTFQKRTKVDDAENPSPLVWDHGKPSALTILEYVSPEQAML
ncbi:hypothetical protein Pint_21032 [Pistacia integerrima]|uniref:Uncharacterized protein n=1 Tax=Pistacia integerrima TaxID=434235 RepID=A0ACC0XCY6_9ROSI|nr:hypothetical protein Pint_21032 [Pistacia integerrima]